MIFDKIANDWPDHYRMPFNDLANFLKKVKQVVTEDQPSVVFTLKGQTCEHCLRDEDFLPDWFKDGLNQHISHRASLCASHHSMVEDFLPKWASRGASHK